MFPRQRTMNNRWKKASMPHQMHCFEIWGLKGFMVTYILPLHYKRVWFTCSTLLVVIYRGGSYIISYTQQQWKLPISQERLLKGFCNPKLSFYSCLYFQKTLEIALSICVCSTSAWHSDTHQQPPEFLLSCRGNSGCNSHFIQEGPSSSCRGGGVLVEFLGFCETMLPVVHVPHTGCLR